MTNRIAALQYFSTIVLSAIACILVFAIPGSAQQLQHVPGTSVSLVPMQGFSASTGLAGFTSEDGGAIMITEIPAEAYDQIYRAASNPGKELVPLFASQGITLQKIEEPRHSASRKHIPAFRLV